MGAVTALKGAATVIAAPDGRIAVNPTGGPVLASGGSGDVLLGMVTGLLTQGLDAFEAAALAAFIHGAAADRISARAGSSGLLAGELANELPATVAELRAEPRSGARDGKPVRFAVSFLDP
jgi:NAD(P)H-hydrate epimerase